MYLNCHTYYSLRYGTFSEKGLLEMASQKGISSLAITDINSTSACLSFIRSAASYGIKPIVGIDFRRNIEQLYVGIAKNNNGFEKLNHYMTYFNINSDKLPNRAPLFENTYIIYPFRIVTEEMLSVMRENEFVGVSVSDLNRFKLFPWHKYSSKIVLMQTVTFATKRDFNAHRLLRAINNNTLLSKLDVSQQADLSDVMFSNTELENIFKEYKFVLNNTKTLMDSCSIDFNFSADRKSQNLRNYKTSDSDDMQLITQLCNSGLIRRYGKSPSNAVIQRMQMELDVIQKMGFVSYFLINWDIITYANSKDYYHVGRGSGANSIIAYLLGITDVDPVELNLYFERFLNEFRASPPDFDIDFSWRDREHMTRYIFDRFPNTALLSTYNTFQHKGVVRELGKVFGLPKMDIDKLSHNKHNHSNLDELSTLVMRYSSLIKGFPNHLGVHAGGILISQQPITSYCSMHMPPKGFLTTDFDMVSAEDVGLYKFDILGQRGIAKIKEAISIVKYNQPQQSNIDIYDVEKFKNDSVVNNLVKKAKCMGCFYVESPGMRSLLQKLETDNYLGLVAASSVIRPGVASSGMMREYILRHRDPERGPKVANPVMLELMPETYGVMVYQEDVIKVAHNYAGLSLSESDVLRRGMAGKYRSREEFLKIKEKFVSNCLKKGYKQDSIYEIWGQIESFAGYSFAKGHSASYAVESYQSLYLKAYFPLEFMVAVLNNGGGFFRSEIYINEARLLGGTIHAPCVNNSAYHTVIRGKDIYLGFSFLKSIEMNSAKQIENERASHGKFTSFDNFIDRVGIGIEQMVILIRIKAFRFTGEPKKKLLWNAYFKAHKVVEQAEQRSLFEIESKNYELPDLPSTKLEDAYDEIELLEFPLCSPFDLLRDNQESDLLAKHLRKLENKRIIILGYMVTPKFTRTVKNEVMCFGTFLDMKGEFIDTVHFPNELKRFPFRGIGVYSIVGKVVSEFGVYSIEVESMIKKANVEDPRYAS